MRARLRILFIGESWLGSCARSMREALARQPDVVVDDLAEDLFPPAYRSRWLRGANRLLAPMYRAELNRAVLEKIAGAKPDWLVTYKGARISAPMLRAWRKRHVHTANIYPDLSPHAHGAVHRAAVGEYDGVISTKPFHPAQWQSTYGYANRCEFVPQGYDPLLHLSETPPEHYEYDVALVATWRPEYHQMLRRFAAAIRGKGLKVAIGGSGWRERRSEFPPDWTFAGALQGRSYVALLRSARICLAPVTTRVVINGQQQPGDVDTTRTYELAAAYCFFIHRRTPYVSTIYDEATEVPLYDTPEDLAEKTLFYLAHEDARLRMARSAHQRAVPAYSNDARAAAIVELLRRCADTPQP